MTRVKSQIQHDYKTLVKPDRQNREGTTHRWFFVGLGIPVVLVALILLMSPGGDSQTARAAIADTPKSEPAQPLPLTDVTQAIPTAVAETPPLEVEPSPALPQPAPRDDGKKTVAIALPTGPAGSAAEKFVEAAPVASPTTPTVAPATEPTRTASIDVPAPANNASTAPRQAPSASVEPSTATAAVLHNPQPTLAAPKSNLTTPAPAQPQVATTTALPTTGRPLALPARSVAVANIEADSQPDHPGQPVTLTIKKGDTLDELFNDNDLSRSDLANILAIKDAKQALSFLMPGDQIELRHQDNRITYLTRPLDEVRTLHVTRGDDGFASHITEMPVEIRIARASATINSSLFLAAKAAGISDKLTMNLAGIFAWDIDFVLDIRKGDRFSVVYEEIWQNGHHLRDGDILAAMFINDGDEFKALRYVDPDDYTGYFTPEGVNVKKAFLRAPIKFTPRVTSNFNPNRMHPVHKRRRPHQGVDYGAPTGTPIIAAGDGKVIFRGRKGGYGNTVILQHGGNITTLYAHMSKFVGKVRNGTRVRQGQTIGYVGATGTVTARHLHYEYRVNGVHRNPRTVSLPKAKPIPKKFIADFKSTTSPILNQLNMVSRDTRVAMAP